MMGGEATKPRLLQRGLAPVSLQSLRLHADVPHEGDVARGRGGSALDRHLAGERRDTHRPLLAPKCITHHPPIFNPPYRRLSIRRLPRRQGYGEAEYVHTCASHAATVPSLLPPPLPSYNASPVPCFLLVARQMRGPAGLATLASTNQSLLLLTVGRVTTSLVDHLPHAP